MAQLKSLEVDLVEGCATEGTHDQAKCKEDQLTKKHFINLLQLILMNAFNHDISTLIITCIEKLCLP